MMKWKKLLLSLSLCIFVTGCSSSQEYPTEYPESPAQQVSEILWPQSPGVDVLTDSTYAMVDMSNASQGYVTARLLSSASKIKLQISKDDKKYNYDLTSMEYTAFPLQWEMEFIRSRSFLKSKELNMPLWQVHKKK